MAAKHDSIRMDIVPAQGALLDRILDYTFELWHEGLSRPAYGRWNEGQLRTAWGAGHLHRFALVGDAGQLLATAKRYRHSIRIDGRSGWMCGIGAVFTPPEHRGRGHASRLVEWLLEQARAEGALAAALFSEIGAPFYERLGFRSVPFDDVTVRVTQAGGAPAAFVRAGNERDFPALSAMHDVRSTGTRLALERTPPMIQYAVTKKRLLAGLGPQGLRHVEFVVAEEGGQAMAYVVCLQNAKGWTLEEAGDRDPGGARLGAILQALLAREASSAPPLIRAWWPAAFPVPPQLELTDQSASRDLFMIRPLADVPLPEKAEDVFYWHSDYF